MYSKKNINFYFSSLLGGFLSGGFCPRPFSLYLNTKLKCNKQWTYLQLSGTYEK